MISNGDDGVRTVSGVSGVDNVTDPYRLNHDWLTEATNVDITNTGGITRRGSATRVLATSISDSYESEDGRLFIVSAGVLKRVMPDLTLRTLTTGLSTAAKYYWAEVNNQVFYGNSTSYGIIDRHDVVMPLVWGVPDSPTLTAHGGSLDAGTYRCCVTHVMPDGRETGASDPTEIELDGTSGLLIVMTAPPQGWSSNVYLTSADSTVFMLAGNTELTEFNWNLDPNVLDEPLETMDDYPIRGTRLTYWQGQLLTAEYDGSTSTVWASEPLQPHLFPVGDNHVTVAGEITLLCAGSEAVIIATREKIYQWNGETLGVLAEYGAPSGEADVDENGVTYFMTDRGVCRAFPFQNLTDGRYSFTLWEGLKVNVLEKRDELRLIITGG